VKAIYEWEDADGDRLSIHTPVAGASALVHVLIHAETRHRTIVLAVPRQDALTVALGLLRGICEAAGVTAPIVLERPSGDRYKRNGYETSAGRVYPFYGRDGSRVATPNPGGGSCLDSPADALLFAAAVATVALDLIAEDARPADADVEALADAIRADERAFGGRPDKWAERAADVALRWIKQDANGCSKAASRPGAEAPSTPPDRAASLQSAHGPRPVQEAAGTASEPDPRAPAVQQPGRAPSSPVMEFRPGLGRQA
jgi:hypothetical protein